MIKTVNGHTTIKAKDLLTIGNDFAHIIVSIGVDPKAPAEAKIELLNMVKTMVNGALKELEGATTPLETKALINAINEELRATIKGEIKTCSDSCNCDSDTADESTLPYTSDGLLSDFRKDALEIIALAPKGLKEELLKVCSEIISEGVNINSDDLTPSQNGACQVVACLSAYKHVQTIYGNPAKIQRMCTAVFSHAETVGLASVTRKSLLPVVQQVDGGNNPKDSVNTIVDALSKLEECEAKSDIEGILEFAKTLGFNEDAPLDSKSILKQYQLLDDVLSSDDLTEGQQEKVKAHIRSTNPCTFKDFRIALTEGLKLVRPE